MASSEYTVKTAVRPAAPVGSRPEPLALAHRTACAWLGSPACQPVFWGLMSVCLLWSCLITPSRVTLCPQVPRCEKWRWTDSFRPQPRPVLTPTRDRPAGRQQQTGRVRLYWTTASLPRDEGIVRSKGVICMLIYFFLMCHSSPQAHIAVAASFSLATGFLVKKSICGSFIVIYFKHTENLSIMIWR